MDNRFAKWLMAGGLLAAGAAGCGEVSNPGAPTDSAPSSAAVMVSEAFADEGWLEVAADDSYALGVSVQARVGSSAERLLRAADQASSLEQLWLGLHEGATEAPPRIRELSQALVEQRRATAAQRAATLPTPSAALAAAAVVDDDVEVVQGAVTSESSFNSKVCKDFSSTTRLWKARSCFWHSQYWVVNTPWEMSGNNTVIDRSYGWNHSPYTAERMLSASTWQPTLNPYTWGWVEWGGNYTGARARTWVDSPADYQYGVTVPPELGVTWHDASVR